MDAKEIVNVLKTPAKVVTIKTDTVYGLICNAFDKEAVDKIYKLKSREKKKPLSIFVKSISDIDKYVDKANLTKENVSIMEKYWPGALTIIFKKKDNAFSHLSDNMDGIGIRIPDDSLLLEILDMCDFPLAETSCNLSGEAPYENASILKEKFGDSIDLIVDGGPVVNTRPSTVVSLETGEPVIFRVGDVDISV